MPRHRMASLMDPRSLLVVADRILPVSQQPPPALSHALTTITVVPDQPIVLPEAIALQSDFERLDLALVCVPPKRLEEALDAVRTYQPQCVLVLRHKTPSEQPEHDMAFGRRWAALNDCLLLGPGSFGLQRPHRGLNLSLDPYHAPEGKVALITQSGSIMAAVLDWSEDISLGFSALISVGEKSDVDVSDALDYLSMDARTTSIVLYLEHPSSSRNFTSALRAAASVKPVVVLKPGRHPLSRDRLVQQTANRESAVFNALLRRTGALRVRHFIQLFSALKVLVHTHRPRGRRIAIFSNGRASAKLAVDVMGPDAVIDPAELSASTVEKLTAILETAASVRNPIVTKRPLDPDTMEHVIHTLADDAGVDGVLVLVAPDPYADLDAVTDRLASMSEALPKPVISCFTGDAGMRKLRKRLDLAGTPAYRTPESAVEGFSLLASYHYSQTLAQQTLPPEPLSRSPRLEQARALLQRIQNSRRRELTVDEISELLEFFYIPIDYLPDAGVVCIKTGLDATPMSINIRRDERFGPYIAFGASQKIEWVADSSRAVDLPPLNRYLTRQLVQRSTLWRGVLSPHASPAALELLYEALERLSEMISELPTLESITIDPLFANEPLLRAETIRIVLRSKTMLVLPETIGYRHLAIHPYPRWMVQPMSFSDGQSWLLRPIRPEDAQHLQDFIRNLSDESRYMRFVSMLRELTPRMLARYTSIDYDRELALVATVTRPNPEHRGYPKETIIGFAHYLRNADGRGAEYALAIADDWQRRGLGARLMRALIDAAQMQGLTYIDGFVLSNNRPMLGLMTSLGFQNDPDTDDPGMRRVWFDLGETSRNA